MTKGSLRGVPLETRFHSGYVRNPDTGCWDWLRSKDKNGYGYIKDEGKTTKAHRVSYKIHNGRIPKEQCVLHKCDNPSCVNPEHLFLGTFADNARDKVEKGRQYRGFTRDHHGERNGRSILTVKDVLWIRANYKRGMSKLLAEKFGVCVMTILRANRGENWKCL